MQKELLCSLVAVALCAPLSTKAVTFVAGPSFQPATNAPLAGALELTTDVDSRVSVSVADGTGTWTRDFYDFAQQHSVILAGFKPGRTNLITVTVHDKQRQQTTASQPVVFLTAPLPGNFPRVFLRVSQPDKLEPGYTLFRAAMNYSKVTYLVIVDSAGEVVWYSGIPALLEIRQLPDGNLFTYSYTNFFEINLLAETVNSWPAPPDLPINAHEGLPTDHGTILYLSDAIRSVSDYPSSTTDPNAPLTSASVQYQQVVELSATNAALLHTWSLIDLLDPRRISYMTTPADIVDSEHSNAIIEDPRDNSLIVSLRHQDAVIKISRATGQLVWILGDPANWGPAWQPYLLTPVGLPFGWQYAQHSPVLTSRGTLLVYDDGNFRACPFNPPVSNPDNYSRAVEYEINEQTMEVSQVWDYGSDIPERLYTNKVGDGEQLPETGNVLITFGSVMYEDGVPPSSQGAAATIARIKEVTHDAVPEVLWDLEVSDYQDPNNTLGDCFVYRSHRIPDLYAHPAVAVADLTVSYTNGVPRLEFSGDPARTYNVEISRDMLQWEDIGSATAESEAGVFQFVDAGAVGAGTRFYRVATY